MLFKLRFEDRDARRVTDVRGEVVEEFRALAADRKLSDFWFYRVEDNKNWHFSCYSHEPA